MDDLISNVGSTPVPATAPAPPAPDHPIFGDNGPMRGFLWDGPGKYYKDLAKGHLWKDPKIFGHNGCQVGQVWCTQFAAWRDGAHGNNVKAVTFEELEGVYSIIVKSKENYDHKDEIFYLPLQDEGPDANTDLTAPVCQAFARSVIENEIFKRESAAGSLPSSQNRFVRVIRANGGDVKYSPKGGLRYDGLYTVERIQKVARDDGQGTICIVTLLRDQNQPPIDLARPTDAEREIFKQIRAGY